MLPKTIVNNKLKQLEDYHSVLAQKEGGKEIEEKLGIRLPNKYFTIQHNDDPLPGMDDEQKEKTYWEKRRERLEQEGKSKEEILTLIEKLKEEKR